eukprot:scaffold280839_cov23-Tisochrysis_lutea.AAC.1
MGRNLPSSQALSNARSTATQTLLNGQFTELWLPRRECRPHGQNKQPRGRPTTALRQPDPTIASRFLTEGEFYYKYPPGLRG